MDARLPAPLRPGDTIAVTAPSSGVPPTLQPRLDLAIAGLRRRGFEVVEGVCLRDVAPTHVSASREARADELMALLVDPDVHAVIPPWGGETGIDVLPLLDLDLLAQCDPTWYVGFSDTTTTMLPLTLRAGWATLHGSNLMDTPYDLPRGTAHWLDVVARERGEEFVQQDPGVRRRGGWDDWSRLPAVRRSCQPVSPPSKSPPTPPTPNMATPDANLPKLDLDLPSIDAGISVATAPAPSRCTAARRHSPISTASSPPTASGRLAPISSSTRSDAARSARPVSRSSACSSPASSRPRTAPSA